MSSKKAIAIRDAAASYVPTPPKDATRDRSVSDAVSSEEEVLKTVQKDNLNNHTAAHFESIARFYPYLGDTYTSHGQTAYLKAAIALRKQKRDIKLADKAKSLPGFGVKISGLVEEYVRNRKKLQKKGKDPNLATTEYHKKLAAEYKKQYGTSIEDIDKTIELFMTIYGVGSVKAHKLYDRGYRDIAKIEKNRHKVVNGKKLLNKNQLTGLKYREDFLERIERKEIDAIKVKMIEVFDSLGTEYRFDIVGSYRREEPTSGDIDVLLNGISIDTAVELLTAAGIITKDNPLARGPSKFMGVTNTPVKHRIDMLSIRAESYAAALLYFTGSEGCNILMRRRAKVLDLRLNEYGLYRDFKKDDIPNHYAADTEEEIFAMLDIAYISPKDRVRTLESLEIGTFYDQDDSEAS